MTPIHRAHGRATVALADALARRGRHDEAIAVLEEASKRRHEFISNQMSDGSVWLSVQDALAELYHRTGRVSDARVVDDELNVLLAFADHDHPIRRRLNARRADSASSRR